MKKKYQFVQKVIKMVDKRLLIPVIKRLYEWNKDQCSRYEQG